MELRILFRHSQKGSGYREGRTAIRDRAGIQGFPQVLYSQHSRHT